MKFKHVLESARTGNGSLQRKRRDRRVELGPAHGRGHGEACPL
jgi:hypothetical protein